MFVEREPLIGYPIQGDQLQKSYILKKQRPNRLCLDVHVYIYTTMLTKEKEVGSIDGRGHGRVWREERKRRSDVTIF